MAWFGLDKLFLGVDLSAEQQRSQELDAAIQQKNQQLADTYNYDPNYVANAGADIAAGNASTGANDVVGAVDSDFAAGMQEGFQNVLQAPGKAVGAVGDAAGTLGWGILKNIPWWVWIGGAIALFIWMGGGELLAVSLRGRLARK
jgi:hypothetical protein